MKDPTQDQAESVESKDTSSEDHNTDPNKQ
jgi:hypothetical protein